LEHSAEPKCSPEISSRSFNTLSKTMKVSNISFDEARVVLGFKCVNRYQAELGSIRSMHLRNLGLEKRHCDRLMPGGAKL
jgi:hypothetical protein